MAGVVGGKQGKIELSVTTTNRKLVSKAFVKSAGFILLLYLLQDIITSIGYGL